MNPESECKDNKKNGRQKIPGSFSEWVIIELFLKKTFSDEFLRISFKTA
jgi:hypothetical protein